MNGQDQVDEQAEQLERSGAQPVGHLVLNASAAQAHGGGGWGGGGSVVNVQAH